MKNSKEYTKTNTGKIFLNYTFLWTILLIVIVIIFKGKDKSFVWGMDGVSQHYVSFNYLCDFLKKAISRPAEANLFDFTLGQGMDLLTTLGGYDFTDPISIMCAFLLPLTRLQRYTVMIFTKSYLVGISFICYCLVTRRRDLWPVLGGAISYTFSGAVLFTLARHPNFINWAYFFPFLLAGIELYRQKKKKWVLIVVVFANISVNYYTFYLSAVLAFIYVFINSACRIVHKESTFHKEAKVAVHTGLWGLCGVLLSSWALLPSVYAFLTNSRTLMATGYRDSLFHYPWEYYGETLASLFTPFYHARLYSVIGMNSVLLFAIIVLFIKKGKWPSLKLLVIVSLLMLCFPFVGRLLNGWGYASNRWVFSLAFYGSVAFVETLPVFKELSKREKSIVGLAVVMYIAICFFSVSTKEDGKKNLALIILVFVFVAIGVITHVLNRYAAQLVTALLVVVSAVQIISTFSIKGGNYADEYKNRAEIPSCYTEFSSSVAPKSIESFFRVEEEESARRNKGGILGIHGTEIYWSVMPRSTAAYYTELELSSARKNCEFRDLDDRTGLMDLASVRYYTRPSKAEGFLPWGYREIASSDERFQLFENKNALPIGYTYDSYMLEEEYQKLNGVEKEQALLQTAVIKKEQEGIKPKNPEYQYSRIDYDITEMTDVSLSDGRLIVEKAGGSIVFKANVPQDNEILVRLKGVELLGKPDDMEVGVHRKDGTAELFKGTRLANLNDSWPVIRESVIFDMGCGQAKANVFSITFEKKATLLLEEIELLAIPMSVYDEHVGKLKKKVFQETVVSGTYIQGNIAVDERRILQFSIPYSVGWHARIDGEETTIIRSGGMYQAIVVDPGTHLVELTYETPYLKIGIIISFATAMILIAKAVICRHQKKRRGAHFA